MTKQPDRTEGSHDRACGDRRDRNRRLTRKGMVRLIDPNLIKEYMFGSLVETDWQVGSPIVWKGECGSNGAARRVFR
jgi:hypothetical protein